MIKAEDIRGLIENDLREKGFFLVDIGIKPSGKICVFADTFSGITLDECAAISTIIENKLENIGNYELEVSSPGLDNPLRVPFQYRKNKGRRLRVIKTDGDTREGSIADADDEKVVLEITSAGKQTGKKKEIRVEQIEILFTDIKKAKLLI